MSAAVEKIWLFLVGMVVLRSINLGEHAAQGLNAQGQGGNIQQQQALHVAAQHAALDGRADGHALIRVDALEGLFARDAS